MGDQMKNGVIFHPHILMKNQHIKKKKKEMLFSQVALRRLFWYMVHYKMLYLTLIVIKVRWRKGVGEQQVVNSFSLPLSSFRSHAGWVWFNREVYMNFNSTDLGCIIFLTAQWRMVSGAEGEIRGSRGQRAKSSGNTWRRTSWNIMK